MRFKHLYKIAWRMCLQAASHSSISPTPVPGMLGLALVLWLLSAVAVAQQLAVPSSWMNTSSYFTRSERISLAQGAIDQIITHGFPSGTMSKFSEASTDTMDPFWNALSIICTIARKDLVSGTQDNKAYVDGELGALMRNDTWAYARGWDSYYTQTSIYYGLACMEAYHAYGDEKYIQKASSLWTIVQANQVTEMNAAYGSHNHVNFNSECVGRSVMGAIGDEWSQGALTSAWPQDMMKFVRMSAYLADAGNRNTTITGSAYAALQFLQFIPLALSPVAGCSLGEVDLITTSSAACVGSPDMLPLDCSTYYAEGALALSVVTQNASMHQAIAEQLGTFLLSATIPLNGVINENVTYGPIGTNGEDDISNKYDMMFSLSEVWNLSISQAPQLANLLQAFTNVQLNAMMANATNTGSNLYSLEWSGPPATTYSLSGMSGALAALIAAIGPAPSQNQTAPAPSSSGSAGSSHHGRPSAPYGAVIGIAIAGGAIVFLTVAYVIARAYRRRRRAASELPDALVAPFSSIPNDPSLLVVTGEKETTIFWREQAPTLERADRREDSTPLFRALQRKEQRAQQRARMEAEESRPVEAQAVAAPEPGPSSLAPADAEALDIQQLLRRASMLSTIPDAQVANLRQRVIELGPIPEVLQVLQDLLRNEAAAEPDLPQYEDTRRQDA